MQRSLLTQPTDASFRRATKIVLVCVIGFSLCWGTGGSEAASPLSKRLLGEDPSQLAGAAKQLGNAKRGAIHFFSAQMACQKCHDVDGLASKLGPALSRRTDGEAPLDDTALVQSILRPSLDIRPAYRTTQVLTDDGHQFVGRLIEQTEQTLELLPASEPPEIIRLDLDTIEEQVDSKVSLMPEGQADALPNRQAFLDLVRYLMEIRDGGLQRAKQLKPSADQLRLRIPEYENDIDHSGMIADWDEESLERGKEIYTQVCVNCHGTIKKEGSLPTALRFATGQFKYGNDPYSMYRTLTHGGGLMLPQVKLVPQQKYDVIHFIREKYLSRNSKQQFKITEDYLAGLPPGETRGPDPVDEKPWVDMDYGSMLGHTVEVGDDGSNFAYKGHSIRLDAGSGGVSQGSAWILFDHDTMRVAAGWTGPSFIDWQGIQMNGRHQIHPRVQGQVWWQVPSGPGWANPVSDSLNEDARVLGRDGRRYGPLPKAWATYQGLYRHDDAITFSYRIGDAEVLDRSSLVNENTTEAPVFLRRLEIGPSESMLRLVVATSPHGWQIRDHKVMQSATNATQDGEAPAVRLTLVEGLDAQWQTRDDHLTLAIPASRQTRMVSIAFHQAPFTGSLQIDESTKPTKRPSTARWPQKLVTFPDLGNAEPDDPFVIDSLTHPQDNPWNARVRLTGLDFYPDGDSLVASTWDGDIWRVSGLRSLDGRDGEPQLTWQRIAAGLFQPLGVKVVDGSVYLTCRDQMVVLRDHNGDGEADFYQCFNNDHQVTEHFHEFAMGLQRDPEGNWYYAKSARHALKAVVPHHGTLLKITPDGSVTEILANGFRAANGVCLNEDGSFIVTDQEGHWNPKNRINWVEPGGFYGNMFGYHDVKDSSDDAMEQPLTWITNSFDRSPAELLWATSPKWGPLQGRLLNLSYGYGKVYIVPFEEKLGQKQGGMCALPIPDFPTGIIRARYGPVDQQLYLCGMFAWAGSRQSQEGGLFRMRATGNPVHVPIELKTHPGAIEITWSDPIDPESAEREDSFEVHTWSLRRTANYGSKHYDEKQLDIEGIECSEDGRTTILHLPELEPTWCMSIECELQTPKGRTFFREIHNTIHVVDDQD